MKTVIFALLSVLATSAFAHTPVPAEKPETKRLAGKTFSVDGNAYSPEHAIKTAEYNLRSRLENCASGKARQITTWKTNRYSFTSPEECIESNGQQFCRGGTRSTIYIATATFRCL